jgi:threonine/homoserine/homoserine lactone efflux protein
MIAALASGFVLGGLGSLPIAGAVSVFVCRRGLAGHFRHGVVLAVGAALAEGAWCLLVLVGADRLLTRWPVVVAVAQTAGGLLLLALGIVFLVRRVVLSAASGDGEPELCRLRDEFRLGATLAGANLAMPVNWLALSTLAISFGLHPQLHPGFFAAGVVLGIVTWYTILLHLLSHVRRQLSTAVLGRLPHLFGVLLVAGGLFTLGRVWF